MSEKSPAKSLIDQLPGEVKENLSPGEEVVRYLRTFEIVERPNYIILTSARYDHYYPGAPFIFYQRARQSSRDSVR